MPHPNTITLACLFAWLTFETFWDLRDHRIPVWFSLVMLLPGLVWLTISISPWPAVLVAVSLAFTELVRRTLAGIVGIFAPLLLTAILFHPLMPLAVGWAFLVFLWSFGILGGADALAGLALLSFFPSWAMVAAILAGTLAWSLALLWVRYRKDAGLRLWAVLSSRATGERQAGLGAYALAALFYGLGRLCLGIQ